MSITQEHPSDSAPDLPPPSAQSPLPPPGWYANPSAPGQRYWDGSKWTDTYSPPPPDHASAPASTGSGRGLTTTSFVLAAASLAFLPIVLGPAAIICAGVALNRKERNASVALAVGVVAMIVGMFLGAVVGANNNG